ncbi:enediyne biosynthesis protein UnbU [Planomonospora sphaerica]|uniref:Enediyne biosynthesis protein UnbU n=1 Tax=Planomonospora sphaerica TaxID=161355 RepID=A0A171CSU5_9ACTN|nr:enediyne biosynthesis protein [Planomonospora sphaerica]GAT67162.1 enediyne biosynthesis protein UnbU [Planomonospora sphaerica]
MTRTSPAAPPRHDPKVTTALRRFAISITIFNVFGYTLLGFEQPWTWPFVALATGYAVEIGLEYIGARGEGRAPRYRGGGPKGLMEFLYPAHITSLAMNMLIYVNDEILTMMFGVVVAVGAKWVLRAPVKGRLRHYMNPSNFGITVLLLLFPWVSIAPPYHFTENVGNPVDWLVPVIIIVTGTLLNAKLTGRMWLIAAWLGGFVLQAVVRGVVLDNSITGTLATMTGVAFILFTNYMITDPGTTPSKPLSQVAFGAGVAVLYGCFTGAGIAYGLFFATATTCLIRGVFLWALHFVERAREQHPAQAPGLVRDLPVTADAAGGRGSVNGHREVVSA